MISVRLKKALHTCMGLLGGEVSRNFSGHQMNFVGLRIGGRYSVLQGVYPSFREDAGE